MKCKKCGGNIEKCAYNDDWNLLELWDCMCDNCGHKVLPFPKQCECGGTLEFNYINDFIESGSEESLTIVMSCTRCMKDYLTVGIDEDIIEYEECFNEYFNDIE